MLSSSFLLLVKVAALCLVPEGCPVENISHNKRIKPSDLVCSSENNIASSIRAFLLSYLLPCKPCGHRCSSCTRMGALSCPGPASSGLDEESRKQVFFQGSFKPQIFFLPFKVHWSLVPRSSLFLTFLCIWPLLERWSKWYEQKNYSQV